MVLVALIKPKCIDLGLSEIDLIFFFVFISFDSVYD